MAVNETARGFNATARPEILLTVAGRDGQGGPRSERIVAHSTPVIDRDDGRSRAESVTIAILPPGSSVPSFAHAIAGEAFTADEVQEYLRLSRKLYALMDSVATRPRVSP